MKEYVRLCKVKISKKKKKNQRSNLPLKAREKLYEKAKQRIFKNHQINMTIPKENMAKLNHKWPITPILNEKDKEKERDAYIMDKDIKPCPKDCSKCPKIRTVTKVSSKKKTSPTLAVKKKKPSIKTKPKQNTSKIKV